MTWNVRLYDKRSGDARRWPNGYWVGTVNGKDEQDARNAALSKFEIPGDADFEVSPR